MQHIRTVLFIQVLNSFVAGILTVALPLMMKERGIDIVLVGLIFAAMPLVMPLGRMVFATFSDFWGRKIFFVSAGFLGIVSSLIYYIAHTPLEYLFGKVAEGTKESSLWAVNRPFLLEEGGGKWKILVHLRTVTYVANGVGSFLAGFLTALLLFEGTMVLCAIFGIFVALVSLTLVSKRKNHLNVGKALQFLDLRKKNRRFKIFLILFSIMGVSSGLIGGFVMTWFLSMNGFDLEMIGLILGIQILLAGLFSYLFSKTNDMKQTILAGGILFSALFLALSFSSPVLAGILMASYGIVDGISSVGQEGIITKISDRESYGTDIGLLWTGFHIAQSASLALTGILISTWGFTAPFLLTAAIHTIFTTGAYTYMKE